MADRRGSTRPGNSYKDPAYDKVELGLERKYNLPAGILKAVRTRGERSNADQVSEAGARSVYQVIPATRDAFLKRYGVDAYANPAGAAEVAALHLRDSFKRGKDWNGAVAEYHGGTDRRNHGERTRAYVARAGNGAAYEQVSPNGATALAPGIDMGDFTPGDLLNMRPSDFGSRRPIGPERSTAPNKVQRQRDHVKAVLGGQPLRTGDAPDLTTNVAVEKEQQADDVALTERKAGVSFFDRVNASVDTFLGNQVMEALSQEHHEAEPGFADFYMKHWQVIEEFADNARDVDELRTATSIGSLQAIQERIGARRGRDFVLDSNDTGTGFRIVAGLADPAGWLAGLGVGKGFQLMGVGSRALAASGKTGAAVTSMAAEGAAGNLAFTGALDAAGEYQSGDDYLLSGVSGLAIGAALSPLALRGGGSPAPEVQDMVDRVLNAERTNGDSLAAQARINAGADASPEKVAVETSRLRTEQTRNLARDALADIPDELRLLSDDPERLLTADPLVRARVEQEGNLSAISDEAERAMVAEHLARAQEILRANPIDEGALQTSLRVVGMESTGNRLMLSKSPVAKAVGLVLLESATGAGGRRRTAALSQATRERVYNRQMLEYDGLYHLFRKERGAGLVGEAWDGRVRREFNDRVFAELEARGDVSSGAGLETHPAILKAADLFERGMDAMRIEQQHIGTVGNARLGATSRGYVPHRMDPRKVVQLTQGQQTRLRDALAEQFIDPQNGFDDAFSRRLATKYVELAKQRAFGSYEVPGNLHSAEAADIVRDALEALSVPADELEKLMSKYSRGGAGHTKRRLRLNLNADLGEGMTLRDLYVTDIPNLYRGYARRVSGEVALAQYGVMGKKGLNVLRKAIQETGAAPTDLEAFDQIAAEFLNTPYGTANHNWLDNVRIATSLARLGGMGFTQIAEYGNGIAAIGAARTASAVGSMPRLIREVTHLKKGGEAANPILASIDTLGAPIGMDDYHLTRLFDVKDNDIQLYGSERIGVITRAVRAAGNLQAIASGHRMITAVQTRGMAEQIVHKAVAMVRRGGDDIALDDMGINAQMREALRGDLGNIATFKGDTLVRLDFTKSGLDGNTLAGFRDAVERGASQIIQRTYIGETGKWAHNGFLKLLLQFRTFSLTSVEKQWGRNRRNYGGLKASMYLLGSMSFAAPIHMARMQAKMVGMSRSEREKFADRNLTPVALGRATLNYASAAGLLGDIIDVGGGFATDFGLVDPDLTPFMGARGQGRGQLVGGVIAPGVGLVEDLWKGVHGDGEKLAKALPGANLPYVAPIIAGVTAD